MRVCVCMLKTFRLVSCRFSLRITKQRSLPVHRPAGRVDQPGEPVQPGPGCQTTKSHILSGPGGEPLWCFSSGFFFLFFFLLRSSSVLRGRFSQYILMFLTNTFILVKHLFCLGLTMKSGTNLKKQKQTKNVIFLSSKVVMLFAEVAHRC